MPARTPLSPMPSRISADEEVHHGLGTAQDGPRTPEVEVHRDLVVGVDAGRDDDIDLGHLGRDVRNPGDVPAQSDDRKVDQGVDPVLLELAQLRDGASPLGRLVPFVCGLLDLRAEDEDVLVHERAAKKASIDRSSHGVDLRHRFPLPACPLAWRGRS